MASQFSGAFPDFAKTQNHPLDRRCLGYIFVAGDQERHRREDWPIEKTQVLFFESYRNLFGRLLDVCVC